MNYIIPVGGDSLSPGAGVGIAFAVIALVLLMAVIGLVIYRRQQWKKYASALGGKALIHCSLIKNMLSILKLK